MISKRGSFISWWSICFYYMALHCSRWLWLMVALHKDYNSAVSKTGPAIQLSARLWIDSSLDNYDLIARFKSIIIDHKSTADYYIVLRKPPSNSAIKLSWVILSAAAHLSYLTCTFSLGFWLRHRMIVCNLTNGSMRSTRPSYCDF